MYQFLSRYSQTFQKNILHQIFLKVIILFFAKLFRYSKKIKEIHLGFPISKAKEGKITIKTNILKETKHIILRDLSQRLISDLIKKQLEM